MRSELRQLSIHSAGPLAGLGVMVAASGLPAFGPDFLSGSLLSDLLVSSAKLGAFALVLCGLEGAIEADLLTAFVALGALLVALLAASEAVDRFAYHQRGLLTVCEVGAVERRVESYLGPEGHARWRTQFAHRLRCVDGQVAELTTTGQPAGAGGEWIDVAYDPTHRLDPRPAGEAGDYLAKVRTLAVALALGLGLNAAARYGLGLRTAGRMSASARRWYERRLGHQP